MLFESIGLNAKILEVFVSDWKISVTAALGDAFFTVKFMTKCPQRPKVTNTSLNDVNEESITNSIVSTYVKPFQVRTLIVHLPTTT